MTRPLRLEYPGALYHVTSRGDRKALIFHDDTDRAMWLQTLGEVCVQFQLSIHAFCQMGNHYHLLIETSDGKLAPAMRQLNGIYSQYFNRRHKLVGHVFQGRYKSILIEKENYLLEVARYIVLNPVRAGLVKHPQDWPWSSYNMVYATTAPPSWLNTAWLLSKFSDSLEQAKHAYCSFVLAGVGGANPLESTYRQLILGSEQFIQQLQSPLPLNSISGISKLQRSSVAPPLSAYQQEFPDRDLAMAKAYRSHAYTITEIAHHFGVSHTTASRAVKKHG
ncbi:addiction module toxin RelE [Pseudoduganella sp. FT55W]|uniref:Addiction module toxin RelE n=1 Tax=Duganella rivi TaxID=2666083 RepID=A0A7X4GQ15_9BURK|nr:transposase [Duganella rivi]MYM67458.1 addiction module toxin RelE [Duganella rivi]